MTSNHFITVEPLSASTFAEFGEVLEHTSQARQQPCPGVYRGGATTPCLDLIRVSERSVFPVAVDKLERHPHSAQTFVPLQDSRFLVVVCKSAQNGLPDPLTVKAFETQAGQIVTFGRNIWHKGITALTSEAVFAMTMLKNDQGGDTEFAVLSEPMVIAKNREETGNGMSRSEH